VILIKDINISFRKSEMLISELLHLYAKTLIDVAMLCVRYSGRGTFALSQKQPEEVGKRSLINKNEFISQSKTKICVGYTMK